MYLYRKPAASRKEILGDFLTERNDKYQGKATQNQKTKRGT
jgi:hypothetical protein